VDFDASQSEELVVEQAAQPAQSLGVTDRAAVAHYGTRVPAPSRRAALAGDPSAVLSLQRTMGNAAVGRLIQSRGAAPSVARTPAGQMASAADEAETESRTDQQQHPRFVSTLTNISDVGQARRARDDIVGYRQHMSEGLSAGADFIVQSQVDDNEHAIQMLDQYIGDATTQGSTLGDFQTQFAELERDHVRLMAEVQAYAATSQGQGTNDSSDPAAVGRAEIASAGGSTTRMQSQFRRAVTSATGSSNTATHQESAQQFQVQMQTASQAVSRTQGVAVAKEHDAIAATEHLHQVVLGQQIGALQGQIEGLKAKAADAKEKVALIGSFVKAATKLATAAATGGVTAGGAVEAGVGVAVDVAGYVASHAYDDDIAEIKTTLRPLQAEQAASQIREAAESAKGAKDAYVIACQDYVNANVSLETAQDQFRRAMREMGASADAATGGGSRFEVIAQLLSEADAYIAQADATIAIGDREVQESHAATQSASTLRPQRDGHDQGVPYWRPSRWYTAGTLSWEATPMTFHLYPGDDNRTGHAEGERAGVNPVMTRALEQLRAQKEEVVQHAGVLRQVFNTTAPR
jgi:hypothetical protein